MNRLYKLKNTVFELRVETEKSERVKDGFC